MTSRRLRPFDFFSETERVAPDGALAKLIAALSLAASLTIAWLALFGTETHHFQVSAFILLILPIAFLTTTRFKGVARLTALDLSLALLSALLGAWFIAGDERYQNWMSGFSTLSYADEAAGLLLVAMTVELCRRCIGIGLTGIV